MTQTNRNEQTPTYVCHAALIIEGDTYVCHAASHANLDMCVVSRKYHTIYHLCVSGRAHLQKFCGAAGSMLLATHVPTYIT